MLANVQCHHCQQPLQFDDEQAGTLLECPLCQYKTRAAVPAAALNKPISRLEPCPDCGQTISPRALMCPNCGRATGVRFRLIWEILGHVMVAGMIFALIGLLFSAGCEAIRHTP